MEDEAEATETLTTDVDAASAGDAALHDHRHPAGEVVVTPFEVLVAAETLTCPVAEDRLVGMTDDAGLLVDHPQLPLHDRALALVPQAAAMVDVGPDLISGRDLDLRFAEKTTTDQAVADVHPLPHLW